jgi:hypothetical protein
MFPVKKDVRSNNEVKKIERGPLCGDIHMMWVFRVVHAVSGNEE